jgi:hypothetical protein
MTTIEQAAILARIVMLRNMTTARGCYPPEADSAALKIGQLVQKYSLDVAFPAGHTEASSSSSSHSSHSSRTDTHEPESFCYGMVTCIGHSEKAVFVRTGDGKEFWVPRSQLRGRCIGWKRGAHGLLYVSQWWARKERWYV